ncbi:unnamed protein product [Prunus brigantina]
MSAEAKSSSSGFCTYVPGDVDDYISVSVVSLVCNPLQNLERIQANFTRRRSHRKAERSDDFDCTLRLKLLHELSQLWGHFVPISVNGSSPDVQSGSGYQMRLMFSSSLEPGMTSKFMATLMSPPKGKIKPNHTS